MGEITRLLQSAATGDASAREALFAVAYPGLEKLARARLRDGGRNTLLDTRGLVHESYLRYVRGGTLRADDRRAFFAFASQVMRSVIVSSARERAAEKRGSGWRPLTLTTRVAERLPAGEDEILRVHDALETLESQIQMFAQMPPSPARALRVEERVDANPHDSLSAKWTGERCTYRSFFAG